MLNTEDDQREKYQITEAGRDGSPHKCLTDCRPQRKHKRDFFSLFLWYWRLLALTSHVKSVRDR